MDRALEAPLLRLDPVIEAFAAEHGLTVTRNGEGTPERSIAWGLHPRCLIQIYLRDEARVAFDLWINATDERGRERYWKTDTPVRCQPVEAFEADLPRLLREARETLLDWSDDPDAFDYVGELGPEFD